MSDHKASRRAILGLGAFAAFVCCAPRTPEPNLLVRNPVAMAAPDSALAGEDSSSARFYIYDPGRLRDPFLRPGTRTQTAGTGGPSEPTPPPLNIEAIALAANPRAIINGKSVGVGDVVDGAKIVQINNNSVEIEFNGRRHTIPYR